MKKTYIAPSVELFLVQMPAILSGSGAPDDTNTTDNSYELGNQDNEDNSQWNQGGGIIDYGGGGSGVIVSAKDNGGGYSGWED